MDIGAFFSAYEEEQKLGKRLKEAFAGTKFASRIGEMADILKTEKTTRDIYLDTLRRFGRRDGLEIYKKLKVCAEL